MELIIHDENDELFQLMKSKMTTGEEQMFMMSHYLYLQHGSDSTAFVVDFDHVWKNVEFTRLYNAKRILLKYFTELSDFIIISPVLGCATSQDDQHRESVTYQLSAESKFEQVVAESYTFKA